MGKYVQCLCTNSPKYKPGLALELEPRGFSATDCKPDTNKKPGGAKLKGQLLFFDLFG
jgi:hypothetical protein